MELAVILPSSAAVEYTVTLPDCVLATARRPMIAEGGDIREEEEEEEENEEKEEG
jgi:hypothetical protein